MSDRTVCLTVVLDKEIRTDDAESTLAAIAMIRGVVSVTANVTNTMDHVAYARARHDIEARLYKALQADAPSSREGAK